MNIPKSARTMMDTAKARNWLPLPVYKQTNQTNNAKTNDITILKSTDTISGDAYLATSKHAQVKESNNYHTKRLGHDMPS